ncbi:hypothetical protein LGH83_13965 [Lichenihabitans sp. PAMC28606]|uniref:general stress protein n=1 Tax=Lichenihabitans sp. PAMC28606 TaxID=2880932 RepID=UPI001D09A220|nr:general stress protein [Lichenihabitans sp. PAMC28606]UDL93666.1 hypothetical protein LGH83_13965 [Lichenihabitans sp. PAMC28606]
MRMIAHSYDTYDQATRAVTALEAAGVRHDDISLVSGDKTRSTAPAVTDDTTETTAAGTGATAGTILGGGAGLLAGIGMLAIPGVGPVVAAGWLIATLTGAGVGAAAGGLLGSLTGAGIDDADAKTYTDHVGRGGTLVTVRTDDAMASRVENILEHGELRADMTAPIAPLGVDAGLRPGMTTRPINRPLTGVAGDAFRDRTISDMDRDDLTSRPNPIRDNSATRAVDNTLGTNVSGEHPTRKL